MLTRKFHNIPIFKTDDYAYTCRIVFLNKETDFYNQTVLDVLGTYPYTEQTKYVTVFNLSVYHSDFEVYLKYLVKLIKELTTIDSFFMDYKQQFSANFHAILNHGIFGKENLAKIMAITNGKCVLARYIFSVSSRLLVKQCIDILPIDYTLLFSSLDAITDCDGDREDILKRYLKRVKRENSCANLQENDINVLSSQENDINVLSGQIYDYIKHLNRKQVSDYSIERIEIINNKLLYVTRVIKELELLGNFYSHKIVNYFYNKDEIEVFSMLLKPEKRKGYEPILGLDIGCAGFVDLFMKTIVNSSYKYFKILFILLIENLHKKKYSYCKEEIMLTIINYCLMYYEKEKTFSEFTNRVYAKYPDKKHIDEIKELIAKCDKNVRRCVF